MKILVTGGAGFIGSHTIRKLLELNYKVVCVDSFDDYYDPKVKEDNIAAFKKNKKFSLYRQNICDFKRLSRIFQREKPEKVCHLAAKVGVRASIKDPLPYIETNISGTLNLLKLSVANNVQSFVFASSSSVYGDTKKIPFKEENSTDNPISPYAATKKAGELLVHVYHKLFNLNCTILRFFTVYGPSGRPDMAPYLFVDSIYRGKPIKKFGKGDSRRDYTYVDDVVDGIISAIEKNYSFGIFNLGYSHSINLNKFISLIEKLSARKAIIKTVGLQAGEVINTLADISKAKSFLWYGPKTSIEKGLKKFIDWYIERNKI